MPSKLSAVQVRFSDPRLSQYLTILSKTEAGVSKSKLIEELSAEPIKQALKRWLISKRQEGATYSELFEETQIPVPELMDMIEPGLSVQPEEIRQHLSRVCRALGLEIADIPEYHLGPA